MFSQQLTLLYPTRWGGGGGGRFLFHILLQGIGTMLSQLAKQSHGTSSADNFVAHRRAFSRNIWRSSASWATLPSRIASVFSTYFMVWISHRWDILKLTFRSISSSSERIQNGSFWTSLRWAILLIKSVDETNTTDRCWSDDFNHLNYKSFWDIALVSIAKILGCKCCFLTEIHDGLHAFLMTKNEISHSVRHQIKDCMKNVMQPRTQLCLDILKGELASNIRMFSFFFSFISLPYESSWLMYPLKLTISEIKQKRMTILSSKISTLEDSFP